MSTQPMECLCCGNVRTLQDGQCHECNQAELDATGCVECGKKQEDCECVGGPWIPGGYRL